MLRLSRFRFGIGVLFAFLLLWAPSVFAQDAGIAGVVKDTSGAVLPGVTVTAASPVLIEQQRVVVTNSEGRYSITALRPGSYKVTFSLEGFSTVTREGVNLSAGFTATVDGDLRVGSLSESITVTGAIPVVDVQNVRKQTVVTNELLEALPVSTKSVGALATLTTGVTGIGDVGGSYQVEPGQDVVSGGGRYHGKSGTKVSFDGMGMENASGNSSYQLNSAAVEEMVMSTSGISADTNADGLVVNVIPKEGSNSFRVTLAGLYANDSLESTNLSSDLIARGLKSANKTQKLFDYSAGIGGPIKKDKIWFFFAPRSWGLIRNQAGTYWNKTQNVFLTPPGAPLKVVQWTPWVDRPEDRLSGRLEWYDTALTRVTYQASRANKISVTYDEQRGCNCGSVSAAQSHEYYISSYRFDPNRLLQATWTSTISNKLLLEAGFGATISQWNMYYNPGVTNDIASIYDLGTGQGYGAPAIYLGHPNGRDRYTQRASMAYVTGSHNFKAGFQTEELNTNTYLPRERQRRLLLLQRHAGRAAAVCLPLSPAGEGQGRPRDLRAGSVESHRQADAEPGAPLGLLQQLRARPACRIRRGHRRLLGRGGYGEHLAGAADVRSGVQRAELEGFQPAARCRVRRVRQWQNGCESLPGPVHGKAGHRNRRRAGRQPAAVVGHVDHARVDRREQELHPGLQPG